MTDAVTQVKENLLFYNIWTNVKEIHLKDVVLIEGIPKEPLLTDEIEEEIDKPFLDKKAEIKINEKRELVLPYRVTDKLTPKRLKEIFDELEIKLDKRPKRIIIGIINDDSTIVYYFIHDGVYKPKRN